MYNVIIVTFRIHQYSVEPIFNIHLDFNGNYNKINKKYFIVNFVDFMFDK